LATQPRRAILSAAGANVTSLELAPGVLLIGIGQGLAITPLVGTILSGIDPKDAGSASGALSTTLQIGNVTGVAALSIVFFAIVAIVGQPSPAELAGRYGGGLAGTLPISALLALTAVLLVRMLPNARVQTANALIERVPTWAAGLAYSIYLATGGRLAQQLFDEILGETIERRTHRTLEAPPEFGDFLAFTSSVATMTRPGSISSNERRWRRARARSRTKRSGCRLSSGRWTRFGGARQKA
jgi:hypothetical protein